MRFIALSPNADLYYRKLAERRLTPQQHVRKMEYSGRSRPPIPIESGH